MSGIRYTIAQKLVSTLAILITLSFLGLVSLHLVKQYEMSLEQGELIAETEAMSFLNRLGNITNRIEADFRTSGAVLLSIARQEEAEGRDEEAAGVLDKLLEDHNELLQVYTAWEPGAFGQGQDRFRLTAGREAEGGRSTASVRLPEAAENGFARLKRQPGGKLVLSEPHYETIRGESVPLLSFALPVRDESGRYAGMIGGDLRLADVQTMIEKLRPMNGYAAIVTEEGFYAANGMDRKRLAMPVHADAEAANPYMGEAERQDGSGQAAPAVRYVDGEGKEGRLLQLTYPLPIAQGTWRLEIFVPASEMLAGFYDSVKQTVVLAIVALGALIALMVYLIKKVVVDNIMQVVQVSSALAKGGIGHKLDIRTKDEFGLMAIHFNRMIDYRKEAEELVRHQATHDLLTGLPNRYGYNRYVESAGSAANKTGQTALLFIDLDRFKHVNDKLDFTTGDMLLKHIAKRIADTIGDSGKVFRFASDEFIVLLENVGHLHQAGRMAEDLLLEIAKPVVLQERVFYVTASIGMSLEAELNAETGDRLLKEADLALFTAKKQRNTCRLYTPSMNELPQKEVMLESGLYPALESNQFMLYYQPKVDLESGRIYAAEALLRWKHPEFGMVPPMEFIPIAEKTGFIIPLGEWVLREACRQVKRWEKQGLPQLSVSVNMSMIQFQQKNIVHTIQSIISEEGVRPQQIELELTESIFMDNPDHTLRILHELKRLGLALSLDDFGTGYSSLSYLQSVPIHYLKLDKSFIHDIVSDYRKQMIFKSLVVIAHNLDLKVVTEGVETAEELDIIKGHQCDSVQGYLYSPPLPPDRFAELYRKHSA